MCVTLALVRLSAALDILHSAREDAPPFSIVLACGFTPLHVETFLGAHLQSALPDRRVEVRTGLYGDLAGTLEHVSGADGVAIVLEWFDLDARLGYRSLGGWGPAQERDIAAGVEASLARIRTAIEKLNGIPVAMCTPTLAPAPAFYTPDWQAGAQELDLEQMVASFAASLAKRPLIAFVNQRRLLEESPARSRFDLKSELQTGFPYTLSHADAVGAALARLLHRPPPKKGLITDLDDTLWNGIVGEVEPEGVSWDLASHSLAHGLYQQLLRALAESGVLIGVASKNDPAGVDRAFARPDLVLRKENVFPLEVHWEPKSKSAARILKAWNIAADSVVFVDDSPMELAEVKAAHPEMECVPFPAGNPAALDAFLRKLRDLFGKDHVGAEDALRLQSVRGAAEFHQETDHTGGASEAFLAQAGARIIVEFNPPPSDARVLELVNKTNQFNLNGRRYTEAEWRKQLDEPLAFRIAVSYEDKFGPLGKIAVIAGIRDGAVVDVSAWVMSCRAFSRRIEDRCLEILFENFRADEVRLRFEPTAKNGPTREFLERYLGAKPEGRCCISRAQFRERVPQLYHRVESIDHASVQTE